MRGGWRVGREGIGWFVYLDVEWDHRRTNNPVKCVTVFLVPAVLTPSEHEKKNKKKSTILIGQVPTMRSPGAVQKAKCHQAKKHKTTPGVAISQRMRVKCMIAVDGSAVVSLAAAHQTELTRRGLHMAKTSYFFCKLQKDTKKTTLPVVICRESSGFSRRKGRHRWLPAEKWHPIGNQVGINLQFSPRPIGRTEHVPQEGGRSRPVIATRGCGKNTPTLSEGGAEWEGVLLTHPLAGVRQHHPRPCGVRTSHWKPYGQGDVLILSPPGDKFEASPLSNQE